MVERQGRVQRHLLVAMIGWRVAALQPPHLAALVAWEGMTDFYREAAPGRALHQRVHRVLVALQIEPQRNADDAVDWRARSRRAISTTMYRARSADLSRVEVPLLSAGNWGALHLHLRGNLEGWAGPPRSTNGSWSTPGRTSTRTTPTGRQELQLRFLDRFLKGDDDALDGVPPVRLAVRSKSGPAWRDEQEWPLARTQWRELYLGDGTLAWEPPPADETRVSRLVRAPRGRADRADRPRRAPPVGAVAAGGLRRLRAARPVRRRRRAVRARRPAGCDHAGTGGDGVAARVAPQARPGADASVAAVPHARRAAAAADRRADAARGRDLADVADARARRHAAARPPRRRHRPAGADGARRSGRPSAGARRRDPPRRGASVPPPRPAIPEA